MDAGKVQAVVTWPEPRSVRALRGFLGLAGYYHKYVKDYGALAAPLTQLLKKDSFTWTPAASEAFQLLKAALTSAPVLTLPDFTRAFVVECDASGSGYGAVLHQGAGPVAFFSRPIIYDAWVIYNFFSLCLAWVGGPGAVVVSLSGRTLKPSWVLMTCCLPAIPLDGRFIRRCKQGCLQFVILKPILVVITFILYAKGEYEDGNFSVKQSYLYITIIYTISYSMALYSLALFYAACRDLLRPYNPVPKFIIIKSVVFLTYWQGVLVFLAAKSRFIKNAEKAADLQNYVLCVEMLIAAIGHLFAFPYKEYAGANARPSGGFKGSLLHALKFNDFYHDTVHQFAPTYNEYVLYNHNEGESAQAKYPSSSVVPSGRDVELAGIAVVASSSPVTSSASSNQADPEETMTTPIKNKVDPPGGLYDLTDLLDVDLSSYPAKVPAISDVRKQ